MKTCDPSKSGRLLGQRLSEREWSEKLKLERPRERHSAESGAGAEQLQPASGTIFHHSVHHHLLCLEHHSQL